MTATALPKLRFRVKHVLIVRPSFLRYPSRILNSIEQLFAGCARRMGNIPLRAADEIY